MNTSIKGLIANAKTLLDAKKAANLVGQDMSKPEKTVGTLFDEMGKVNANKKRIKDSNKFLRPRSRN